MSGDRYTPEQIAQWSAACNQLTGVHCGRLDLATYSGDGQEMQRFVYTDQHSNDERTKVSGPYCDEVAFMAARYPVLREQLAAAEKFRTDGLAAMDPIAICEHLRTRFKGLFVFMNGEGGTIDFAGGDLHGAKARLAEAVKNQKEQS